MPAYQTHHVIATFFSTISITPQCWVSMANNVIMIALINWEIKSYFVTHFKWRLNVGDYLKSSSEKENRFNYLTNQIGWSYAPVFHITRWKEYLMQLRLRESDTPSSIHGLVEPFSCWTECQVVLAFQKPGLSPIYNCNHCDNAPERRLVVLSRTKSMHTHCCLTADLTRQRLTSSSVSLIHHHHLHETWPALW